jgi:hypothetical protein
MGKKLTSKHFGYSSNPSTAGAGKIFVFLELNFDTCGK